MNLVAEVLLGLGGCMWYPDDLKFIGKFFVQRSISVTPLSPDGLLMVQKMAITSCSPIF